MSKELYIQQTIKSTGVDENGAFVVIDMEIRTDNKKSRGDRKIYINGRAWFSNTHNDYAYTPQGNGKVTIHNDEIK